MFSNNTKNYTGIYLIWFKGYDTNEKQEKTQKIEKAKDRNEFFLTKL